MLLNIFKCFCFTDDVIEMKDTIIKKLDSLEKKITEQQLKTQSLITVLNSDNMDDAVKKVGYEITEDPILDHCDNDILKELM